MYTSRFLGDFVRLLMIFVIISPVALSELAFMKKLLLIEWKRKAKFPLAKALLARTGRSLESSQSLFFGYFDSAQRCLGEERPSALPQPRPCSCRRNERAVGRKHLLLSAIFGVPLLR